MVLSQYTQEVKCIFHDIHAISSYPVSYHLEPIVLGYWVVLGFASIICIGMSAPYIWNPLPFLEKFVLLRSVSLIRVDMGACADKIKERIKNCFTKAGASTVRSSSDNDCFRFFTFLLFLFEGVNDDVQGEMGV